MTLEVVLNQCKTYPYLLYILNRPRTAIVVIYVDENIEIVHEIYCLDFWNT